MTKEEYYKKLRGNCNPSKEHQTALPSKYPQGYFKEKECKKCGVLFTPNSPSELYCSDMCKDYIHLNNYYVRVHGITLEEYLDRAERQNFKCAICGGDNFKIKECSSGGLVVDHCHATGKIRGLLCHNCNRALGLLKDSPLSIQRALNYIKNV